MQRVILVLGNVCNISYNISENLKFLAKQQVSEFYLAGQSFLLSLKSA
nr:MAG TPA: hypothetical protein [Caudoviricetes sp.]